MSEDVHSSTFPRVTDICANQVAPFLSRARVFEKLKKWNLKSKNIAKVEMLLVLANCSTQLAKLAKASLRSFASQ